MSTLVGTIVAKAKVTNPEVDSAVLASCLALIAGCIIAFFGLIRWGWIVELIPLVSISAFMTGSALNIAIGQVPGMMGITTYGNKIKLNARDVTYKVIINTLRGLPNTTLDAALGLTALAMLYIIRSACSYSARRWPQHQKKFFFLATLRTAFVILLYTLISWLMNRHHRSKPLIKILGVVPRGELLVPSFISSTLYLTQYRLYCCSGSYSQH